jgi:hypothetical protein
MFTRMDSPLYDYGSAFRGRTLISKRASLKKRLYAGCAVILLAGLLSATWIYRTADEGPDLSGAYQIIVVNGVPQPVAPNESKIYVRDLQRYGGKMAVVFDDINRWFAGLWRGKSLALTVAFIAVCVSFALYFIALALPEESVRDGAGE